MNVNAGRNALGALRADVKPLRGKFWNGRVDFSHVGLL
jgi:hypothetical protein